MDLELIAFGLALAASFAAGVIFGKHVISEAQSIKLHVTEAETRIRTDVAAALKTFTTRL